MRHHKHEHRREKREKKTKGHEGSRERGRVKGHKESKKESKKRSKHRHSKKKGTHGSPTRSPDTEAAHHHTPSMSPVKKLTLEELATAVANDDTPSASNTPLSGEGLLASTSLLPPTSTEARGGVVACEEEGTQQELLDSEGGGGGGVEHLGRSEFSVPASGEAASEVPVLPTQQNGETNTDAATSSSPAEAIPEGAESVLGADTEAAGDSVGGVADKGGEQEDEMLEDAVEVSLNAEEVGTLGSALLGDMPPETKSPQEAKEKGKKREGSRHGKGKDKDTHPGECAGGGLEWNRVIVFPGVRIPTLQHQI